MIRTYSKIGLSFFAVFSLVLWIFFVWVYPDDTRIPVLKADFQADSAVLEFVGSILKTSLPHSIDMEVKTYKSLVIDYSNQSDYSVVVHSKRFTSPYQVLLTSGVYPWRLEAADGLAIPAGHMLSVDIPPTSERLEFLLPNALTNQVAVSVDDGESTRLSSRFKIDSAWLPEFLMRTVRKHFFIGSYSGLPRWQSHRMALKGGGSSKLKIVCELAEGVCIIGDPRFYRQPAGRKPRQTIMVLIDTLRSDAVSEAVMPRLTALAAEGVYFSHAIAPGNMTSPSTNGVLACQTPTDLGAVAFAYTVGVENSEKFYQNTKTSFPERLKAEGIYSVMVGNISVVSDIYGVGVNHGFEHQILSEIEGYETPLAISEAIRWLDENRNRDFFLYVHLNNPHAPYKAPLRYIFQQYLGLSDLSDYPSVLRWLYRGEAAFADFQIGRLFDYLEKKGLKKQVDLVVTSDHGDQHSNRSFSNNQIAQDFSGTYFDHGATLYNDEIRVPLILRRSTGGAQVIDEFVSTLWIGKTILGMNGVAKTVSGVCTGEDLIAFAAGNEKSVPILGSEGFQARALLFDGRYKYIRTYDPTEKRIYTTDKIAGIMKSFFKREQLFDLRTDPDEAVDLARESQELLGRARTLFRQYFKIDSAYTLVLESPGENSFEIGSVDFLAGKKGHFSGDKELHVEKSRILGTFQDRLTVSFAFEPDMKLPSILINGSVVPVKLTTMKLPVSGALRSLPEESLSWVRSTPGPSAYIARVLDERRKDRKIALGNPAFEKVLREWGYINEN